MSKHKWNRNYEEVKCKSCGKISEMPTWRNAKFCNPKCANSRPNSSRYKKGHTESIEIRIRRIKNIKKNTPKGKAHYNYIDGRSKLVSPARYGKDWLTIRQSVLERDLFKCQYCGKDHHEVRLDVHHKIPFLHTFDNSLSNLVTLCVSCHKKVEARLIKQMKEENMIGGKTYD